MIKELVQFTEELGDLKSLGIVPRDGLHILLSLQSDKGQVSISPTFKYVIYSRKKQQDNSPLLTQFAILANLSWMINPNKCFDLPAKGIHTCSPYCLGFKRENLEGGSKFAKGKSSLYDRLNNYFAKATELQEDDSDKEISSLFGSSINSREKIQHLLNQIPEYSTLKDGEYLILYLDIPADKYKSAHDKYLRENLFNTEEYNIVSTDGQLKGTSNFFNGYNAKKPFLLHNTAPSDISGRVSSKEANLLYEFQNIINASNRQPILPNPLPLFIYPEERQQVISLLKKDVFTDRSKKGYKEIITQLLEKGKNELGNYYLLFYRFGEIKDFDFVSKFQYTLNDERSNEYNWKILNLFQLTENDAPKRYPTLDNVFDLIPHVFTIALGDKYKKNFDNFFDELKEENYTENDGSKNEQTLLAVRTYRKAIYDYIYKSRKNSITAAEFQDIMTAGIKDDLKRFKKYRIKEKLNIFFSLNHHFDADNSNFNGHFMPDKLQLLIEKTMLIADSSERVAIDDEIEFAFISGQVIRFLFTKSNSENNTHAPLEPFLQKKDIELFKNEVRKLFEKYTFAINNYDVRTNRLLREVMGFETNTGKKADMGKFMNFMLAGYCSPEYFYRPKEKKQ